MNYTEKNDSSALLTDIASGIYRWKDNSVYIGPETIEKAEDPAAALKAALSSTEEGKTVLIGLHNRLGLRYAIGDRDPYTGRNFDGIENYRRSYGNAADAFSGRAYDKAEIEDILRFAGVKTCKLYSVFAGLDSPTLILADGYLPKENLESRINPVYGSPDTVFLEEQHLYKTLVRNGLLHTLANAFLIEIPPEGMQADDALQITASLQRGHENASITIVRPETVEKNAVFSEGKKRLSVLYANMQALSARGIATVPIRWKNDEKDTLVMPRIEAPTGEQVLGRLLADGDKNAFFEKMEEFRGIILSSSDTYEGTYLPPLEKGKKNAAALQQEHSYTGKLFKKAYLELVPQNAFYMDGRFVFFDQEFCEEDYPVNGVLNRMLSVIYYGFPEAAKVLPPEEVFRHFGLLDERPKLQELEWRFLSGLRNDKILTDYRRLHMTNANVVNANRQRMNFSTDDYQRLFVDIFEHADSRKLVLFGSGTFARQFLALYGRDYPVSIILDNNKNRWGQELSGIPIESPEVLKDMGHGEYKVIICIKNYLSVMKQLETMGIREYSIYDAGKAYKLPAHPVRDALQCESLQAPGQTAEDRYSFHDPAKKYHIGYIAGVFDLYHIGHLNMFRRAREQCDYLIVGVVSDEGVKRFKGTQTFVPFAERIEMVRSCRYVDEAVEIPLMFGGTEDAWRLYHFDVQFSGSDYINDANWLREKDFLEKHGATMEFFPYTKSTSSTKIKKLIDEKIVEFEGNTEKPE